MEVKYLSCANYLVNGKCSDLIFSYIMDNFELQEKCTDKKASSIGDDTFRKANDICSECDNYVKKD